MCLEKLSERRLRGGECARNNGQGELQEEMSSPFEEDGDASVNNERIYIIQHTCITCEPQTVCGPLISSFFLFLLFVDHRDRDF
jgi:hypothetical protein